jgi:hypothetical protein
LATALLALARTRRNWPIRIALWLVPSVVLLLSWILFGFFDLDLGADEYAAPGYRHHSLNILAPVDPQQFSSLLFKNQGVFPGQSEGYAYLGAGIIFLIAVSVIFAPAPNARRSSRFGLWLVAGLSFAFAVSSEGHLWPKRPALIFHCPAPWSVCFPHSDLRPVLLGGLLHHLVLLSGGGVPVFPEIAMAVVLASFSSCKSSIAKASMRSSPGCSIRNRRRRCG